MKKSLLILSFLLIISGVFAQEVSWTGIQSPNAASLGTFGSIPVNYFTGTPDISIPIYTIKSGNITFPVVLRYHPGNVRPNEHPGWVGCGWNLQCFGVITRVVNFLPDENDVSTGFWKPYYSDGADQLDVSDWESANKIRQYFSVQDGDKYYDVQADDFYFNFLGYSGKFVWTAQGWTVVSDKNIKVKAGDFTSDFIKNISTSLNNQMDDLNIYTSGAQQSRMFKQFTLITDDGTQYIFGGEDAIEYTAPYGNSISGFVASAWYLKKIIDVSDNTIEFNYHRNYPICKLSFFSQIYSGECEYDWSSGSGYSYSNVRTTTHGGYTIFPVYLSEIIGKNETLNFSTSYSNELRYTTNYFRYFDENSSNSYIHLDWLNGDESKFKWEQLDEIQIKDKQGNVSKKYKFNYSSSSTQRLTLNSLEERNVANSVSKQFSFAYNNITGLPGYGGDKTDHWGYYNNTSVNGVSFSSLYTKKATNQNVISTGLLTKITYPTKGYTEFDWETHQYGKVVSTSRQSLDSETGYAGGCRIKEIRSYTESSSTPLKKTYYYVSNYTGGSPTGLASSGVLNGRPQYYFVVSSRPCAFGECTVSYSMGSVNSLVSYSYNAFGSHIGYSEVIEQNTDGSFSKYLFTNYGTDHQGISHYDKPASVLGWKSGEDRYIPTSELHIERGKPASIQNYNSTGNLVENTTFYYNNSSSRFNKYIKKANLRNSIGCEAYDALILAAAYKEFTYRYNLSSKSNTIYNENGQNPVTTWEYYTYNDRDLLSSNTFVGSNESLVTKYKYASDYFYQPICCGSFVGGDASPIYEMQRYRVLEKPIEIVKYKNGLVIDATYIKYNNYIPGSPYEEYKLEISKPINNFTESYITTAASALCSGSSSNQCNSGFVKDSRYVKQTSYSYDFDIDRIKCVFPKYDEPTSYIWNLNGEQILAEIKNARSEEVYFNGFEENIGTNYISSDKHTGVYCLKVNHGAFGLSQKIEQVFDSEKDYKLSAWIKTENGFDASNGNQANLIIKVYDYYTKQQLAWITTWITATNGAWKLFERTVDLNSITVDETNNPMRMMEVTIEVWNSNNSKYLLVDDVRFQPKKSVMTTYTYHPIFGMTSSTDNNGISTYYDYDSFGRLWRVKDHKGNVLKQFEYHYK